MSGKIDKRKTISKDTFLHLLNRRFWEPFQCPYCLEVVYYNITAKRIPKTCWKEKCKETRKRNQIDAFQKENKEHIREYHKKWYKDHLESETERIHNYYIENREKILEKQRQYRNRNKGETNEDVLVQCD